MPALVEREGSGYTRENGILVGQGRCERLTQGCSDRETVFPQRAPTRRSSAMAHAARTPAVVVTLGRTNRLEEQVGLLDHFRRETPAGSEDLARTAFLFFTSRRGRASENGTTAPSSRAAVAHTLDLLAPA